LAQARLGWQPRRPVPNPSNRPVQPAGRGRWGSFLKRTETFWSQYGPYLALVTALTAMLGSLYYSEIVGFIPCTLCWYQRILMYPLNLILLVGILKQDRGVFDYVLPLSVVGIGFSTYHYLIQLGVIAHSPACQVGIPCGLRYVNYFGFVTIPLMALVAFLIITAVSVLGKWTGTEGPVDDPALEGLTD
jgi:disulfide bond formation protein DsbB